MRRTGKAGIVGRRSLVSVFSVPIVLLEKKKGTKQAVQRVLVAARTCPTGQHRTSSEESVTFPISSHPSPPAIGTGRCVAALLRAVGDR